MGVVRVMDKLMKDQKFLNGVRQIRHVVFVTGEEVGWARLKAESDAETYDPSKSDSRSIHTTGLDDTLASFATLNYVALLGLAHLDIAGLRRLYAFSDANMVVDEGRGGDEDVSNDGVIGGSNGVGEGDGEEVVGGV